ncbi:MAG: Abequosyltransferase RfbV [Chlamydiae bacterium]|nr:Abequosyltransferase RfbV [Chlamydiota bacterium]
MSDETLLSFCIPTYNFGEFIGETLASIVPQMEDNMEIVIVDGGSTDSTEEIVSGFQKMYPNIYYHKFEQRGGIDRDMALSISLAKGKYCWLFSADDVLKRGAVAKLLSKTEGGIDVYLVGLTLCGLDVDTVLSEHFFSAIQTDMVVNLSDEKERLSYFENARTTTAFFSFMSSLIIDRKKWKESSVDERFYGNCWTHVVRLFNMIPQGLKLKLLPESYMRKRGDNDSFMEHGAVHRAAISIDGFHDMGKTLFGEDSKEAFHFRRVVRNELSAPVLLAKKAKARNREERRQLNQLAQKNFSDPSLKNRLSYALYSSIPTFTLPLLQKIWRLKRFIKT